jgi:hypothetical protein
MREKPLTIRRLTIEFLNSRPLAIELLTCRLLTIEPLTLPSPRGERGVEPSRAEGREWGGPWPPEGERAG